MSLLNLLEEFVMFEKIRKMKNKKGFTLVELIVVLVILAILAALLVPALTGYIDKANNQKVIATTRQVVMAAQTEVSEAYGKASTGKLTDTTLSNANKGTAPAPEFDKICSLAEVSEGKNGVTAITIKYNAEGHVTEVKVTQSGKTCTYNEDATQNANNENYYVG